MVTQAVWLNMWDWSWAVRVPKEMTFIARANDKDSDQPAPLIHPSLHTAILLANVESVIRQDSSQSAHPRNKYGRSI